MFFKKTKFSQSALLNVESRFRYLQQRCLSSLTFKIETYDINTANVAPC